MQGRLQGKRVHAPFFVSDVIGHGTEGCNYLLAVDVDMNTVDGYSMSSWHTGYGDLVMKPDFGTLRRVPWHPGTAMVQCDVTWLDGADVVASPRQILRRRDCGPILRAGQWKFAPRLSGRRPGRSGGLRRASPVAATRLHSTRSTARRRSLSSLSSLCFALFSARRPTRPERRSGLFAPLLVLGAQMGFLFGALFDPGASDRTAHAATFAVVGMAAFFTAVARAPLTGIILVTEMTDNSRLLLPMLAACFSEMAVATMLREPPIYDALKERTLVLAKRVGLISLRK